MEQKNIPIYAAPLQGFTETAWRNAHRQVFGGVEAYYTPFIRWEKGGIRNKDKREIDPGRNAVPRLVPQVIASDSKELECLVSFLDGQGYQEIDVNMGCPFPLVANRGKGAGILPCPKKVEELLASMEAFPDVRFSVKMRLGWKDASDWRNVVPLLNASCVRQVTLHPRIGKQQYKGEVNREEFAAFYEACKLPLVYNGDLRTPGEMHRLLADFPRLSGIMVGRGLLADPSLAAVFYSGVPLSREELYRKVAEMHRLVYRHYSQCVEGGEAQLLQKMKTMWEYWLPEMEKKARKRIQKSSRLADYLQAVDYALSALNSFMG